MKFLSQLSQRKLYRIIMCLVVVVFLLVNLCASLAGEKFSLKLDMTAEKLYELSDITEQVCEGLVDKTDIFVVAGEGDYPSMFQEILSRYAGLSPQITVSYIDPFENPLFVDHYKQQGYSLSENDVVVSGQSGVRQIAYDEMLVYSNGEVSGIRAEQAVTGAILYVNSGAKPTALFTAGHNERVTGALQSVFEDNNFTVSQGSLAAGGTAGELEADIVVVASPVKDFETSELNVLRRYMERGGRLMVFMEPGVNPYPNLSVFLAEWNLSLENNVIFEKKAYVSDNPINLIPMYASHPVNAYFAENPYYVVMPSARGIGVAAVGNPGVKAEAVLTSTSDSYAKSKVQYTTAEKESGDGEGPFVLAAMAEKSGAAGTGSGQNTGDAAGTDLGQGAGTGSGQVTGAAAGTGSGQRTGDAAGTGSEQGTGAAAGTARLFLTGSRSIYADDIMSVETYANRDFFTQTIRYMTESETGVSIPAKTLTKPPLAVTMQTSVLIGAALILLLPLCLILRGWMVYRKRKNL